MDTYFIAFKTNPDLAAYILNLFRKSLELNGIRSVNLELQKLDKD